MAASRREVLDGDVVVDILCFGRLETLSRVQEGVSCWGSAGVTFYIFLLTWESSALIHT